MSGLLTVYPCMLSSSYITMCDVIKVMAFVRYKLLPWRAAEADVTLKREGQMTKEFMVSRRSTRISAHS